MSIEEFNNLKNGAKVKYSWFANLTYIDNDGRHVLLEDKTGSQHKIYASLFLKHGEII